jgi:mannitol/fructose-specific phosphotransferase system IIA component (Ntr-type)
MDLSDFLGPEPLIIDLEAEDRWQAIEELINHLVVERKLKVAHRNEILAAVKKRETSMTTGIGLGIAIPHAATDLVSQVVAVLGRSQKGIQFDALDGVPVKKVCLFLIPQSQFNKHLHALANMVKLLHCDDFGNG